MNVFEGEIGGGLGGGAVDDMTRRIRSKEDAVVDAVVESLATMRPDLADTAVDKFRQYQLRTPLLYTDGDTERISPLLTRLKQAERFADLPLTHVARRAAVRYRAATTGGVSGLAAAAAFNTFAQHNRLPYAIGTFRAAAAAPDDVVSWLRSAAAYAFVNQVLLFLDTPVAAAPGGGGGGGGAGAP